jgi:phage-related tail fiber protein
VNDGSVTWIVDDIRDGALPGDICDPSMIVRAGRIKTNGAVISRVAYPRLFRFASNNNLIVSEANWSGGYWGLFGAGDGSTTFRMPDIRGVDIRGYDDSRGLDPGRVLGTYQADAIQNITGSWTTGSHNSASGAFYIGSDEGNGNGGNSDSWWNKGIVGFDASRVVRTAAETHSKNIDYYRTMKY